MQSAIWQKQTFTLYKLLAKLTNLYSPTDRSSFELPPVWFWVKEKAYGVHLFHTPVTVIFCFTVVQKSKNRECHRSVCLLYFYSLYFRLLLSFFRQRDFQNAVCTLRFNCAFIYIWNIKASAIWTIASLYRNKRYFALHLEDI